MGNHWSGIRRGKSGWKRSRVGVRVGVSAFHGRVGVRVGASVFLL